MYAQFGIELATGFVLGLRTGSVLVKHEDLLDVVNVPFRKRKIPSLF